MLVRTFSKNTGIPASDIINYLDSQSQKKWSGSSNLTESEIILLNQHFDINSDSNLQLSQAKEKAQLPPVKQEEPMNNSQLATSENSSITETPLPKNLQPHQLAAFERFLQAEEITLAGTQDAIEDRELYLTTYEKTLADLRIDSVKTTITRIKTNKADFLKRQAERKKTTEGRLEDDAQFIAENQQWLADFKAQNAIIF